MINAQTVKLYQKVTVKNTVNGQVQNTFPVVTERFLADVQSSMLTKEEAYKWGQTDLAANSKIVFIDPNANVRMLDRIVDEANSYFEIKGINPWPIHWEMLLVPVPGEVAPVSVDGVALSPTTLSLAVLATHQFTPTFTPASPTNQAVTWGSSNPAKATVSASGLVTAVAAGTTVVTVTTTDGGFQATCTVTVTP